MPRRISTTKGFARAVTLMQPRIKSAGQSRGFAITRLLTHWPEVVGPELAPMCHPVKVGYAKGGLGATLTVLCQGAQAPLVEMQRESIRMRVNACYGYNAIARVRITQTAPSGFAEGQAQFTAAPKPARPAAPDPEVRAQAAKVAQGIGDDALRRTLETLGAHVLTKNRSKGSTE